MPAPIWAQNLTIRVALEDRREDLPDLLWRRKRNGRQSSSGVTYLPRYERPARIVVVAGSSRIDQKLILLHELAHWLAPPNDHHSPVFWDIAWRLYRQHKVPIRYAKERESEYRQGAVLAYKRSRKGGA